MSEIIKIEAEKTFCNYCLTELKENDFSFELLDKELTELEAKKDQIRLEIRQLQENQLKEIKQKREKLALECWNLDNSIRGYTNKLKELAKEYSKYSDSLYSLRISVNYYLKLHKRLNFSKILKKLFEIEDQVEQPGENDIPINLVYEISDNLLELTNDFGSITEKEKFNDLLIKHEEKLSKKLKLKKLEIYF